MPILVSFGMPRAREGANLSIELDHAADKKRRDVVKSHLRLRAALCAMKLANVRVFDKAMKGIFERVAWMMKVSRAGSFWQPQLRQSQDTFFEGPLLPSFEACRDTSIAKTSIAVERRTRYDRP